MKRGDKEKKSGLRGLERVGMGKEINEDDTRHPATP